MPRQRDEPNPLADQSLAIVDQVRLSRLPSYLGLSAIVVNHPPPTGPIGLVFFAGAVVLIARAQPARRPVERPEAAPSVGMGV